MHQYRSWAVVVLLGLNAVGSIADDTCVVNAVLSCSDSTRENFSDIGCHDAAEAGCLCLKQMFVDGVSDCTAKTCGDATADQIRDGLTGPNGFCQNFAAQLPAASLPAASSATASTSAPPESTSSPSPSSAPPASSSSSPSTVLVLAPSTSSQATGSIASSAAATSSHSSTSTAAAGETSPTSTPAPAASGLSSGAAAAIGIGVAIVVVVVASIAFCLLKKKKSRAAPRHSMEISKPLPGSGRTYPTREDRDKDYDSFDKYGNDIEMTSNRYEDMVPSQQPRTMV